LQGIVAVPLLARGQLVAILVLGQPVMGGTYGRQELEILFDLATQLATGIRDVTLHQQLAAEKEFTERILSHMSNGVVSIGRDHRIGIMNRRAEEILGLPAKAAIGQDLRVLPSPLGDLLFDTLASGRALPRTELQLALNRLSLEVSTGEIVALVGPNGAGKTTALRLVVGLLSPTSGRVLVGGHDVHRAPSEAKRHLSFVPDEVFFYEQLTVGELVGFVGAAYEMPVERLSASAQSLLELFGLLPHLGQRVGQLSYGMRSRLALVAALLHRPELLVMDEPFFGLDPASLRLMKRLLVEYAGQGMSILVSTHQLQIVEDVAHRILILRAGRVMAQGSLGELRARYGGGRLEDLYFQLTSASA